MRITRRQGKTFRFMFASRVCWAARGKVQSAVGGRRDSCGAAIPSPGRASRREASPSAGFKIPGRQRRRKLVITIIQTPLSPRAYVIATAGLPGREKDMKIAQIAPLMESVPPRLYGGTERIVSHLTDELVRLGHEVTLFASADSLTAAERWAARPWHCASTAMSATQSPITC